MHVSEFVINMQQWQSDVKEATLVVRKRFSFALNCVLAFHKLKTLYLDDFKQEHP